MSYQFPVDTCVVACSGPSLNKVDVFSLGLPVCAISTTIRSIPTPHYWFIADHLNEMHGQEGQNAWSNPNIVKVVPSKTLRSAGQNVIQHPYLESREANKQYESLLFDANKPLLRGPHKTLTFAIQWLHVSGVKNIIFAGNDLIAERFENKYSYPLAPFDKKKEHNFKKTLDQIKDALFNWYPVARSKGYNWYSWECGSVFEGLVPKYQPGVLQPVTFREYKHTISEQNIFQPIPVENSAIDVVQEKPETSQTQYFRLLSANKNKQPNKEKVNMNVYFDLLHKRKK